MDPATIAMASVNLVVAAPAGVRITQSGAVAVGGNVSL
jgi:hypothetical protein